MTTLLNITMSLDGFVAGPNQTLEEPLGEHGEDLHQWIIGLESWREQHGREGGERNADGELVSAMRDRTGAFVMGRRMFSGGEGSWEDDPNANSWWGDDPPFDGPVFVVTHHEREPLVRGTTTYTFVDGVEEAIGRARESAGSRQRDPWARRRLEGLPEGSSGRRRAPRDVSASRRPADRRADTTDDRKSGAVSSRGRC